MSLFLALKMRVDLFEGKWEKNQHNSIKMKFGSCFPPKFLAFFFQVLPENRPKLMLF